ncbi:MAG: hypothetical protein Aurels2KO_18060 [Aureliella sp.]
MAEANATKNKLPTKWLAILVIAFIAYALVQPMANKRFGWNLPSAASILGNEDQDNKGGDSATQVDSEGSASQASPRVGSSESISSKSPTPNDGGASSRSVAGDEQNSAGQSLKYGFLKDIGRGVFQSPAGLQYVPMSNEEKHRLNHIKRHLEDQPSRPVHGVFDGDMAQVVRWLDEAYLLVKSGDKRARQSESGRRDVYDVRFEKPIGYVGGKAGKRKNKPDARNLRMVLEGNKVVTAYPSD